MVRNRFGKNVIRLRREQSTDTKFGSRLVYDVKRIETHDYDFGKKRSTRGSYEFVF